MRTASVAKVASALQGWPGLYVLGAGASVPTIPATSQLVPMVQQLYWDGGIFPAAGLPHQDSRARRFIEMATRPMGYGLDIITEITQRMSSGFVQAALLELAASARNNPSCPASYRVFCLFPPSHLLNYNLDGLAERWCRPRHNVVTMHGEAPPIFGTPLGRERVRATQDYNLPADPGSEIMLEPETPQSALRIPYGLERCAFVALIGYSFSRTKDGLDDFVSFKRLCQTLKRDPRPMFVIDPAAEFIADMVANEIQNARVFPAPFYWNVMAAGLITLKRRRWTTSRMNQAYDDAGDRLL